MLPLRNARIMSGCGKASYGGAATAGWFGVALGCLSADNENPQTYQLSLSFSAAMDICSNGLLRGAGAGVITAAMARNVVVTVA